MFRDLNLDEQMLVSAVRYALGRSSYITHATASQVRRAWGPRLTFADAQTRRGPRTMAAELESVWNGEAGSLPAIDSVTPYDGDRGYLSRNAKTVILSDIAAAIDEDALGMDIDARLWRVLYDDLTVDDPHMQLRGTSWDDGEDLGPDQGYPSDEELDKLRTFHGTTREYFEFVFSIWRNGAGYSVTETERWGRPKVRIELVTGGWSGCESVISTVNQSILGIMSATEWGRGGLWVFEVSPDAWESTEPRGLGTIGHAEDDGRIPDDPPPCESKEARLIAEQRDRIDVYEGIIARHDAYLTSMMSAEPGPTDSSFLDASADLYFLLEDAGLHPDRAETPDGR